ncbi:MAG: hypothetical protein LDLANPLL_01608 [Turneriella sp.]|nr:hypothetical protein [Turneriella sp.]
MKKPSVLLLILAIVALVLFLPSGTIPFLVGTLWHVAKVVIVILAIIIIVAYFRKKK